MKLFRRHQETSREAIAPELSQQDQTLIIGAFFTVCGHCQGNADLGEASHLMEHMEGEGCGVTWKFATTDTGKDYSDARPDLQWVEPNLALDGITNAMEESIIGGIAVFDVYSQPPTEEM